MGTKDTRDEDLSIVRLVKVLVVASVLSVIVIFTLPGTPAWFFVVLGVVANLIVPLRKELEK